MNADPRNPPDLVAAVLQAASAYRIGDYERLLAGARTALPVARMVREVCSPLLHEAGDRWERGEFSVVQEHLLSSAIRRTLSGMLDELNQRAADPPIAYGTLSGERHEIGSLMLAVIGASLGSRAIWLGPDLPAREIGLLSSRVSLGAVAISIVTSPAVIDAIHQLGELRGVLPDTLPIWLGGLAIGHLDAAQLPAHCTLVRDAAQFAHMVEALRMRGTG